jgi:hypothetical protein
MAGHLGLRVLLKGRDARARGVPGGQPRGGPAELPVRMADAAGGFDRGARCGWAIPVCGDIRAERSGAAAA